MRKVSQTVFLVVTMLMQGFLLGCAQEKAAVADMVCQLSAKRTNDCSSTPVLQYGVLTTSSKGTFELKGHYDACFHVEDIIIKGKYKHFILNKALNLELLATYTDGSTEASQDFPRTIGFVKLNNDTLEGTFVDIWATIRAQEANANNKVPLSLHCIVM